MAITKKPETKLLSELFKDIEEAALLTGKVLPGSNTQEQASTLRQIDNKLRHTQKKIITSMIREAVTDLHTDKEAAVFTLDLAKAVKLIEEIEKKAKQMNLKVVIAVYNPAANPIAVHCMDDAYIASFDIAVNKAYTCAALKMSTATLKTLSQPGQELYGIQHTNQGRIVIFGGGEPLYYKNKLVGALGVSGGSESQDTLLAEYGKDIIEEVMKW